MVTVGVFARPVSLALGVSSSTPWNTHAGQSLTLATMILRK